jgi:hypothetical protein
MSDPHTDSKAGVGWIGRKRQAGGPGCAETPEVEDCANYRSEIIDNRSQEKPRIGHARLVSVSVLSEPSITKARRCTLLLTSCVVGIMRSYPHRVLLLTSCATGIVRCWHRVLLASCVAGIVRCRHRAWL